MKILFCGLLALISSIRVSGQWTLFDSTNSGLRSYVYSICSDSSGVVWFTSDEGVTTLKNNIWTTYSPQDIPIGSNAQWIMLDKSNFKWVASTMGLSRYDDKNWINYNNSTIGVSWCCILSLATDSKGRKWFGSTYDGLIMFDDSIWHKFDTLNSGLIDNNIGELAIDSADNIWIISGSKGLSKYDGNSWVYYNSANSGLLSNVLFSVAIDKDNSIWIGTDKGISILRDNIWTSLTPQNSGLHSNSARPILFDHFGNKWFGHGDGVSLLRNGKWTFFSTDLTGYNVRSIAEDKKSNDVWFSYTPDRYFVSRYHNYTGLLNENIQAQPYLYPNPVIQFLWIANSDQSYTKFYLTGMLGSSIQGEIENNRIDLGVLQPGLYVLTIEDSDGGIWRSKIIKN